MPDALTSLSTGLPLTALHRRRLRDVWRSAGWPCRDAVELELLASGLLQRHLDLQGRETLHVSDAGLQVLVGTLQRNRAAFDAHEALVARVALQMQRAGRVVWRGLKLRAPLPARCDPQAAPVATTHAGLLGAGVDAHLPADPAAPVCADPDTARGVRWVNAMPDVFSIRHTTVEDYAEPVVHEIKVRRADLLADVRRADKGAAYCAMASQCWYVLAEGIGTADDVPDTCGVMLADHGGFTVLRPAPRRAMRVPFAVWMALDVPVLAPMPDGGACALAWPSHRPTTSSAAPQQAPPAAASS